MLIGRDRELHALREFVAEDGGLAVVRGPAGIGKSALLEDVRGDAGPRRVLATTGVQSETALPFAALERLLRGLLDGAEALPDAQREALLAGLGLAATTVTDHFLIGLATLNLLADAGPVVALVDDAQWLDAASAEVLAFVARRIESEPITLIVAHRDATGPFGHPALDLVLAPLDDASALSLLDRSAPPPAAQRRLLALAAGNPLALVELPRTALALDGTLPLTERLERSFGAELPALAPSARALLQVAAADETDDAAEILAATRRLVSTREDAGPGGGGAAGGHEADVEAAVAARLLERDGVRLRFRHPLVRSAIYQAATDQERRAAHAAVAAVVGDPHRRAWHRAAARAAPDDDVAASLAAAAADARRRGAIATAAQGFARAADLSTTREGRLGRVLAAAELRAELGDADAAVALVARAEQLPLDPVARARILLIRETFAGDATDDAAPVRALLAAAEQVDADLALRLLLAAGTRCWWAVAAGAPVRGEVIAQTLRLGVAEDDPRVIAVLAATSAVDHAPLVLERLARACAEPQPDPFGAHLLGQAAHMVGQSELAVRQLARVEVQWRAQGRLALLAQALVMRAWSSIQLGNWPAIEPAAEEADRLTRETAQPLWEAGARSALAAAAGARGDYERTLRLAAEVDVQLANARPTNLFACLQVARGVGALGAARHAEAFDQFARMFDPADQAHHYAECHAGVSYLAEAALQCGRIEEARAVAEGFAALLDRPHATLVAIGVDVARAFIDETPVTDPVARFPFHRARVLLAEGSRLRRRRRAADSRAPLRTARDLFDALGTVPWAERARQELRASGERPIRRVPEARDELTPQELQIVRMAASGLSNPEIGERLFLSARTIGSHLYRAFPKLGVTSRGELAAALNDVN